jgi:N-formylglutamate amidohydrolase
VNSFAFWVKLSLTVPLGFALTFCTVQYSRERRLEEEYAFKSSISVSLNPYRDLIHSILEEDGATDQTKYSDFVVDAVRNVFTPPTDKVFDTKDKTLITEKTLKKTAEIIGTVVKAAK